MATYKHIRSNVDSKRPTTSLADGQIAINTNVASPGVFFKDSAGTGIVKVGPVHVGTSAPNATPGAGGSTGNSKGEQWLDTSLTPAQLKVWNGSAWVGVVADELPVSKLQNGSAYQLLQTDAAGTGVEWASNIDVPGSLNVTSTAVFDSTASHPLGSAAAPTITFTGDANTGIYSPGIDQVAVATGGTGRLYIDSSGKVGIGTTSPGYPLDVSGAIRSSSTLYGVTFAGKDDTNTFIRFPGSDVIEFYEGNSEAMRINSAGNVGIGTSNPQAPLNVAGRILSGPSGASTVSSPDHLGNAIDASIQVVSEVNLNPSISLTNARSNNNGAPCFMLNKASGDLTTPTVVGDGNTAGSLVFNGYDGANYIRAAQIDANIDGTPGTNDMPGRLVFSTTADGASSPTERMRINSAGNVGIGTTSPSERLDIGNGVIRVINNTVPSSETDGAAYFGKITGGAEISHSSFVALRAAAQERARITSSGNVGIGTTNPTRNLVVNTSSGNAFISVRSPDTGFAGLLLGDQTADNRGQISYNNNGDSMQFLAAASEKMRITSDGDVGIGTSSPTEKLAVLGTNSGLYLASSNQPAFGYHIRREGTGGYLHFTGLQEQFSGYKFNVFPLGGSAETNVVVIDNNGNVGIGTDSPLTPLHVKGDTATISIKESSSNQCLQNLRNSSTELFYVGTTGTNWNVQTNAIQRFSVTSTGKVGIGTDNPLQTLHLSSSNPQLRFTDTTTNANFDINANSSAGNVAFNVDAGANSSQSSLIINTRSSERLRIVGTTGNVGIGTSSPQATLDVNGDALINTLTVGLGSGSIGTNTAVGSDALDSNTTGANNTAIGRYALLSNTQGNNNTALGLSALNTNTTGISNTAVGRSALSTNGTGNYNTAVGRNTLFYNTDGDNNTAIGQSALLNNTTGEGNIGIGGVNSAGTYAPVFNTTTQDNRIVMGSTSVTNAYVQVAWTVTSDARDKTNFAPVPHGLDFVKQLQPTAYQFKAGSRNLRDPETNELIPVTAADELPSGPVRYGFKAQDILALEGDNPVIIDNEDPDHLMYRGEALVPVLVNAIKEQQVLIDALTARLDAIGNL